MERIGIATQQLAYFFETPNWHALILNVTTQAQFGEIL